MKKHCVGSYLKQLRKEKKYSQKYVSDSIGLVRQTYSTYETGKIFPPADTLVKLANLYEVSIDSFYIKGSDNYNSIKPELIELKTPRFNASSILYNAVTITKEAELIKLFREVEERDQNDIIDFLKLKARQYRNSQRIKTVLE